MLSNYALVWIDSDYALSGTAGSFSYKINIPQNEVYDHVALLQASIPKSYYLVTENHNTLTLTEGASSVTITIPEGNYSMHSFRSVLQLLLNTYSPNGYTYAMYQPAMTTEPSTGKYTFTVTDNDDIQPYLTFPSSSELFRQCGFAQSSTNQFVSGSLESTYVVDFNNTRGLMIKSDMIQGVGADAKHGSAILQEIFQFNTFDFSNIGFQNSSPLQTGKQLVGPHPNIVNFTITDLNDKVMDFNGGSVNFSLLFYKKDTYHDLAIRDLKIKWFQELQDSVDKTVQKRK